MSAPEVEEAGHGGDQRRGGRPSHLWHRGPSLNGVVVILLRAITSAVGSPADHLTCRKAGPVIREELTRLFTWQERHRRLAARLLIALGLTLLVLAVGSVLILVFESGVKGGDIHGYGDAVFFTAVQLLTISSAITNP